MVEKLQHVPVRHWSLTEVAVKSANVLKEYRLALFRLPLCRVDAHQGERRDTESRNVMS